MTREDKIRGAIYSRFKSKADFADALGWSRQKLHYALAHPENMKMSQIQEILSTLGIAEDPNGFSIFLP